MGNVMIDTLVKMLPRAEARPILEQLNLAAGEYLLATLHRPSNVDQPETLNEILAAISQIGRDRPVIFPVHPRTRKNIANLAGTLPLEGVHLLEPLGYLDFLRLVKSAGLVLTDSGGIQEETTYLGVPCLTARANTERPITITHGTNRLVASTQAAILEAVNAVLGQPGRAPVGATDRLPPPELWDGKAPERIAQVLCGQK